MLPAQSEDQLAISTDHAAYRAQGIGRVRNHRLVDEHVEAARNRRLKSHISHHSLALISFVCRPRSQVSQGL